MPRKLTHDEFIERINNTHGNKFSFIDTYEGSTKMMTVHCNVCHTNFFSTPNSLMSGRGCKKCSDIKLTKTQDVFIQQVESLYGKKFTVISEYTKIVDDVTVECNEHKEIITLRARTFLKGNTCCSKCTMKDGRRKTYTTESYIDKLKTNKKFISYDFSKLIYKNTRTDCIVICDKGHEFVTKPGNLNSGRGCNICSLHTITSKPVQDIIDILDMNGIIYEREYKFDGCVNTHKLPFDFYIPLLNVCIEYDGKQHYEICDHWGGEKEFINRTTNDTIKNTFCEQHNIQLIRIRYDEDHIKIIHKLLEDIS